MKQVITTVILIFAQISLAKPTVFNRPLFPDESAQCRKSIENRDEKFQEYLPYKLTFIGYEGGKLPAIGESTVYSANPFGENQDMFHVFRGFTQAAYSYIVQCFTDGSLELLTTIEFNSENLSSNFSMDRSYNTGKKLKSRILRAIEKNHPGSMGGNYLDLSCAKLPVNSSMHSTCIWTISIDQLCNNNQSMNGTQVMLQLDKKLNVIVGKKEILKDCK